MKGNSRLKQVTYPGCSATATTSGFSIAIYSLSCNKTNLLSPYADMPVNGLMAATEETLMIVDAVALLLVIVLVVRRSRRKCLHTSIVPLALTSCVQHTDI